MNILFLFSYLYTIGITLFLALLLRSFIVFLVKLFKHNSETYPIVNVIVSLLISFIVIKLGTSYFTSLYFLLGLPTCTIFLFCTLTLFERKGEKQIVPLNKSLISISLGFALGIALLLLIYDIVKLSHSSLSQAKIAESHIAMTLGGFVFGIIIGYLVGFLLQSFNLLQKQKKVVVTTLMSLILLLGVFIFLSSQPTVVKDKTLTQNKPVSQGNTPPQVYFEKYNNQASIPIIPQTVSISLFHQFKNEDIGELAKKLGVTTIKETTSSYVVVSNMNPGNIGYGTIQKYTGAISYKFYGSVKPRQFTNGMNKQQEAVIFLKELGIADQTVTCPITYEKKPFNQKSIIYVECHRDWQKIGLPILSPFGVLNIPQNQPLHSLSVGQVDPTQPKDSTIIQSSTGQNGYSRPSDFNTATVSIYPDGTIASIDSNIRKIDNTTTIQSSESLLTPQQALNQFLQHKADFSLTLPQGSGVVDFNKIYQGNTAQAKEATITDYVLTYLELPGDTKQTSLSPFYLIRGNATLTTGYHVTFTQLVSAQKQKNLSYSTQQVAGEQTQQSSGLQIKTFTPSTSPKALYPTSADVFPKYGELPTAGPTNTPTPTIIEKSKCEDPPEGGPSIGYGLQILTIPGLGKLKVTYMNHTYYYVGADFQIQYTDEAKDAFYKAVEEQYVINIAKDLATSPELVTPPPKSEEDVSLLFGKINGLFDIKSRNRIVWRSAPWPVKETTTINNEEVIDTIYNNTTRRILDIITSQSVSQWAGKEDIFPNTTNDDKFYQVLTIERRGDGLLKKGNCYISGVSPSLFLYTKSRQGISIKLPEETTFTDPDIENRSWNVITNPNGVIEANNTSYSHLYYEYNSSQVRINKPKEGFIVHYDQWPNLINTLANKLALSKNEKDQLEVEVQNALYGTRKTSYLKLSLAKESELNTILPLNIIPQPTTIHRVHVLLTPLEKYEKINEPQLSTVTRNGFTVIEIGARVLE